MVACFVIEFDGEYFTKWLSRKPDGWYAVSSKSLYEPFRLDENTRVVGRVRDLNRKW